MTEIQLNEFLNSKNYDIRLTHNARWIDQKCTPDVVCIIADCIENYITERGVEKVFTSRDIWFSKYAIENVQAIFRKVDVDDSSAENEYDKFFQQPMKMLAYAGILEETKLGRENQYTVKNRELLSYVALRERNALTFIIKYVEKVLADSGLIKYFDAFFQSPNKNTYEFVKEQFCRFTIENTSIGNKTSINGLNKEAGVVECRRIFIKIINPLAFSKHTFGTERGHISKHAITYDMLMYNRDNFRDIYAEKPKTISRKEYVLKKKIKINEAYYAYMSAKAKQRLRKYNDIYRGGLSEMLGDTEKATNIHHIFPANEFPEISAYLENLIALTPTQHFNHAHPNGKTTIIDKNYQHDCLIVKTDVIRENIEHGEEKIYDFNDFKYVLRIGFDEATFMDVETYDYDGIKAKIELEYVG